MLEKSGATLDLQYNLAVQFLMHYCKQFIYFQVRFPSCRRCVDFLDTKLPVGKSS